MMKTLIHSVCRIGGVALAVTFLASNLNAGFTGSGPYLRLFDGTTEGANYYNDRTGTPALPAGADDEREALEDFIHPTIDVLQFNRYKVDVGTGNSSGYTHKDSYSGSGWSDVGDGTVVLNGSISWDGSPDPFISDTNRWLYVKDGNNRPWFAFDLGSSGLNWDGKKTIRLYGFYPNQGAISHVSIYGGESEAFTAAVPEPASLAIWLTTAIGGSFAARRRRRRASAA